jgi:peptidyl-prolyl cis-trans isomerase C
MKNAFVIVLVAGSIVYSGCGSKNKDDAVAVVNGTVLTESELYTFIPQNVFEKMSSEDKESIIKEWVHYELLYQEGKKRKLDREPEIARILANSRRDLLSNEALERELKDIPAPGDQEIDKYYEENRDTFVLHETEYSVRYAFFEDIQAAQEFAGKIGDGGDFSELAGKESRDQSAFNGGKIGTISEESADPNIWQAVVSAAGQTGQKKISSPFRVADGYGIVQVDAVYQKGTVKPVEALKEQIADILLVEKREQAKEALLKKLEAKARITYNIR